MQFDQVFSSGNGAVTIGLKRYYTDKDGNRFDKASEAGDNYEACAEIGVSLDFNPESWDEDTRNAALQHSFTRKAQEHFQAVIRGEGNMQEAVDTFPAVYAKLIKGEREKAEKGQVSSEDKIIRDSIVNLVKGKKTQAEIEAVGLAMPPKTAKGTDNWNAWSKAIPKDHPWYIKVQKAYQKQNL